VSGSRVTRALSQLLGAWTERGARSLGGAYAQAARRILNERERLEDLRAERRHQLRKQPTFPAPAPKPAQSRPN